VADTNARDLLISERHIFKRVERMQSDVVEVLFPSNSLGLGETNSLMLAAIQIAQWIEECSATKFIADFRTDCSAFHINEIVERISENYPQISIEVRMRFMTVTGYLELEHVGNLHKILCSKAIFVNEVRINVNAPLVISVDRCEFHEKVVFAGSALTVRIKGGQCRSTLSLQGQLDALAIEKTSVEHLELPLCSIDGRFENGHPSPKINIAAIVEKSLDIYEIKCADGVALDFRGAKFSPNAHISIRDCKASFDFRGVALPDKVELLIEHSDVGVLDLRGMYISTTSRVVLRNQSLRGLLVNGTNLDRFSFSQIFFAGGRKRAYLAEDAFVSHLEIAKPYRNDLETTLEFDGSPVDLYAVLSSYRQLIINFDNTRDFVLAEDLHVREMQLTKRLRPLGVVKKWRWLISSYSLISPHALYGYLASYGASYRRAFLWLFAFVIVVFPLLFMHFGLDEHDRSRSGQAQPPLQGSFSTISCSSGQHCTTEAGALWGKAFTYTLIVSTFQKDDSVEPHGWKGKFVKAVAPPIILGQLALFLVALRRKFRRLA
jgi:hypothetical protein